MRKDKEPDAYGLLDEGDVWYSTPFRSEAEGVLTRTGNTDSEIVALYRQPTLTAAELKAVRTAAFAFAQNDDDAECAEIASALLGLAERFK